MSAPARLAAWAIAAAILATERGRGAFGSVLIAIGSEMLPHEPPDPARDARIHDRVIQGIADMMSQAATTHSRNGNGHHPPI